MATTYDIRKVVYGRLQTLGAGVPVVSAYKGSSKALPRLEVQPATEVNRTITMLGDTQHTGEIAITIVVGADTGEDAFGTLVDALQGHFPAGYDLGGGVTTLELPTPRMPPILDGAELRLPVLIKFRAYI